MSRYLIQFSYDGGSFHGFQSQPNAHTVQSELDEKLGLFSLYGLKFISYVNIAGAVILPFTCISSLE